MNGQTIGWDEAVPSDSENAGLGDDRIRSIKTSARIALDDEHLWPSSGGSNVGAHRLGTARVFIGNQSLVSSSGTDGRLMFTSDTSRLFGVGSGGTVFLGGPTVLSLGTFGQAGGPTQRHHWVAEVGGLDSTLTTASGYTTVTFPNSGFSGIPAIMLNAVGPEGVFCEVSAHTITKTGFVIRTISVSSALVSNVTVNWISIGTRAL